MKAFWNHTLFWLFGWTMSEVELLSKQGEGAGLRWKKRKVVSEFFIYHHLYWNCSLPPVVETSLEPNLALFRYICIEFKIILPFKNNNCRFGQNPKG